METSSPCRCTLLLVSLIVVPGSSIVVWVQEGGQTVSPKQEQAVVAGEREMLLAALVHESDSSSHGCRPSCRRAIAAPVE